MAGIKVVPEILAMGSGGGGIKTPSADAIGEVVFGSPGKDVAAVNGAKSVLKNKADENGEKGDKGKKLAVDNPGIGDQNGLKNGEINCACAPKLRIKTEQDNTKKTNKAAFLLLISRNLNISTPYINYDVKG
ncbi:hypothetical protein JXL19_02230 [bacterium]|nr:hypothetical protein [bacterium]